MTFLGKLRGLKSRPKSVRAAEGRAAYLRQKLGLPKKKVTPVFARRALEGERAAPSTIHMDQSKLGKEFSASDISNGKEQEVVEILLQEDADIDSIQKTTNSFLSDIERRYHSPEFKSKVALAAIKGDQTRVHSTPEIGAKNCLKL